MTWSRRTAGGLFLTLAILGFLLALQLRVQQEGSHAQLQRKSSDELTSLVAALNQENERLQAEVTDLRLAAQDTRYRGESDVSRLDEQAQELNDLYLVTGLRPAYGRGLRLVIRDQRGELNAVDLDQLINELKASGAEAVMVNGRRLDTRSSLLRTAEGIALSGEQLLSPYVVDAVGNPADLESAMEMAGGVVPSLETRPDVTIRMETLRKIEVPTVTHEPVFLLARKASD